MVGQLYLLGLLVLNKYASSISKLSYFQIIEGSAISKHPMISRVL